MLIAGFCMLFVINWLQRWNKRRRRLTTIMTDADRQTRLAITEPIWLRLLLTVMALVFLALIVILPLVAVFVEALRQGAGAYFASFDDPDVRAAIQLT